MRRTRQVYTGVTKKLLMLKRQVEALVCDKPNAAIVPRNRRPNRCDGLHAAPSFDAEKSDVPFKRLSVGSARSRHEILAILRPNTFPHLAMRQQPTRRDGPVHKKHPIEQSIIFRGLNDDFRPQPSILAKLHADTFVRYSVESGFNHLLEGIFQVKNPDPTPAADNRDCHAVEKRLEQLAADEAIVCRFEIPSFDQLH